MWRKANQKKTPVSRLTLRVGDTLGAHQNSLRSNRPVRFFPSAPPMLGAGQRELNHAIGN